MGKLIIKPLKGKKEFSRAFENGKFFYGQSIKAVVLYKQRSAQAGPDFRGALFYAALAPKKAAKKAVVRNRIKRLIRESLRLAAAEFDNRALDILECVIFIWRKGPEKPGMIALKHVKPAVEKILRNAVQAYTEGGEN